MRDREEVLEKFRDMRAAKLKERTAEYMARVPVNCSSNMRFRVKGKGVIGFCQNPCVLSRTRDRIFVCADDETARRCGWYSCKNTPQSVEEEFGQVLASPSRCGEEYPKLAMMIWFLQGSEASGRGGRFLHLLRKAASSAWGVVTFRWW